MSIYLKLTYLCLFLIIFTGLTLLYFVRSESNRTLEEAISKNLGENALNSVGSIDRFLYERLQDIKTLASDPVLRNPKSSSSQLAKRIREIKELQPICISISYFDADRVRLADSEGLDIGKKHSKTKYWLQFESGENWVIDVSRSESLQQVVIHFGGVVRNEANEIIGYVISRVAIDKLYDVFRETEIEDFQTKKIDLIDENGMILYTNTNPARVLNVRFPVEQLFKKERNAEGNFYESEDSLYFIEMQKGYMNFEGKKWTLILSVSKDFAYQAEAKFTRKLIYIMIPVLLVSTLLTLVVASLVTYPVVMLSRATEAIGEGNLDTPIYVRSKDEIGKLARNVEQMALKLKSKISEQAESNLKLNELNTSLAEQFSLTNLQKQEVEKQKMLFEQQNKKLNQVLQEIDQKNKAITASIVYAERIQVSMLPNKKELQKQFSDSFILDLPKDIVSGDFYWFDEVQVGQNEYFVMAVVDCTGHGVPGGFMSILGSNLLSSIILEEKHISTSDILLRLNKRIKKILHQETDHNSQDGMELALCVYDKKNQIMTFSGAHRPLYLIRNGSLFEFEGDRYTMGGINIKLKRTGKSLTHMNEHSIALQKNDCIYLFSDGYKDQISEETGKKYSTKLFKETFVSIHQEDMDQQEKLLEEKLKAWKGKMKQIDDILILGVRV